MAAFISHPSTPPHHERDREARDVSAAQPVHEEIGRERAERHDVGMRELIWTSTP